MRTIRKLGTGSGEVLRRKPHPMHPGIHLQPAVERTLGPGGEQPVQLQTTVDHGGQTGSIQDRHLVGRENAVQQQDRGADAGLAQLQRLLEIGDRKTVGLLGEDTRDRHRAMSVGIGLDDRERPRTRRKSLSLAIIVADRIQMNAGADRTGHGGLGVDCRRGMGV